MKWMKKNWFVIVLVIISLIRFLLTFKLPNFYLSNLDYDDNLMMKEFVLLRTGKYLGTTYYKTTLIKGPLFPFLIFIINLYKVNYSSIFTLLYISASLFLTLSLKDIIKDKKYLVFIYLILVFNPVTYSQDLFQRLYRNSISITEFIFFFGCVIRVLFYEKNKVISYILLGISITFMFLTREDNLWTYRVLAFIVIYTIIKNKNYKIVLLNFIPFIILIASLNYISYVNYKHYGIYTYNEIQKSEFHNTYKKILQIKDSEKIEKVAIPKSTLYLLAEKTESFLTKEEIDYYYEILADENGEINNGNIIWYLRDIIFCAKKFTNGKQSEKYYKKLGEEIDQLFKDGTLKKEFTMPSIYMSVPTAKEIRKMPGYLLYAIGYTTTYQDIKTMTNTKDFRYSQKAHAYYFVYYDYHNTVNIIKKNPLKYEIIRLFYRYFTILFSIVALIIYFMNILKFDKVSILSHLLIVMYGLIIGGVVYTHTTSFHAIRPLYLGNIYLIQSIFILINISRININKIIKFKKQKNVNKNKNMVIGY